MYFSVSECKTRLSFSETDTCSHNNECHQQEERISYVWHDIFRDLSRGLTGQDWRDGIDGMRSAENEKCGKWGKKEESINGWYEDCIPPCASQVSLLIQRTVLGPLYQSVYNPPGFLISFSFKPVITPNSQACYIPSCIPSMLSIPLLVASGHGTPDCPRICLVAFPKHDNLAENCSSAATQHRGQSRHCRVVRMHNNTGELLYSKDFSNTYYHPNSK